MGGKPYFWQRTGYLFAVCLELRGQDERTAERVCGFIDGKSRMVGRDFEKHPTRLTEIYRMKIIAVDYGGRIHADIEKLATHLDFVGIIFCAKCDMMHGARPHAATR